MKKILFSLVFFAFVLHAGAQGPPKAKSKFMRSLQRTIWTAGISGVVVDDDARAFKKVFDVKDAWSFLPFPSRATLEGFIDKGISVEESFLYTVLKKGQIISDQNYARPASQTLIAFDLSAKYDLNELIGDTKWFSPYVIGGFGYTHRALPKPTAITANFGLGFTLWFYKGFGLNVQSMAKFALNNASNKNYLMHSVGVVYRFNLLTGYKTPGRLGHRYNLFRND